MSIFKLEEGLEKILIYIANKLDGSSKLIALRRAMIGLIPILLLGGTSIIIKEGFTSFARNGIFIENYLYVSELISIIIRGSIGLIGLYGGVLVSYFLSREYEIKSIECVLMTVFSILITSLRYNESGVVDTNMLGEKGIFTGIIIGMIVVCIYNRIHIVRLATKKSKFVPEFIKDSIETMGGTFFIGIFFICIRGFIGAEFRGAILPDIILEIFTPIIGLLDNMYIVVAVIFIRSLFWYFGIHSGVITPLIAPILVIYVSENIIAMNLGINMPHFLSMGVFSGIINFTGTGVTIGLVISMLLSKKEKYRKLGKKTLKLSLFGVNEPLLFGVPIVKNKILAIPFLIGGTILGTLPIYLIKIGYIRAPIFDVAHLPIFLEGFLVSLDYRIILVQLVQILLSVLIYYPFFKMIEKRN
ncbi:MAG: PTS transporter subunit EIIC [Clostridium sp.]|uniref:PTS transporter subunit EIIC n=1 Tax=Clostridium sp. TaxID=1506 RepID=UPI003F3E4DF6